MARGDHQAPDPLVLRRATPDDAGAIAAVRVEGWQRAYRGQLDGELLDRMSAERDQPRWRAHLASPPEGHRGFVAERGAECVGFVTCGPARDAGETRDVAEIYAIYVRPPLIGTGIGRALLGRAMDTLREDGYGQVILWVLESNAPAHRFYEAAGFRRDGDPRDEVMDGFAVREVRYRYRFHR